MPTTTLTGTPYPAYTDTPDVPRDLLALVQALEPYTNLRFASTTARDTAIPTPVTGQMCMVAGRPYCYTGAAWEAVLSTGRAVDVTSTTSGAVIASGFTLSNFWGYKASGVVSIAVYLTTTAALTASAGNVSDTLCVTLPVGYRPLTPRSIVFGNGLITGEAYIATDGTINLRAASDTVSAGSNIRLSDTFVTG